jgi:putative alpha-1,2-mannosidase
VVFSCLGHFPDIPGIAGFVVGSPHFNSVTIQMANGNIMQIDAPEASDENRYVQSLTLDGQDYNDSPWIPWDAVSEGATLCFSLADGPNTSWGTAVPPPSFGAPCATGAALSRQE